MVKISVISSLLFLSISFADSERRYEPGPIQDLTDNSGSMVEALLGAKTSDLKKFKNLGNTITKITYQANSPQYSSYIFTRETCTSGIQYECHGGATLRVNVETRRSGTLTEVIYKSELEELK